MLGFTNTSIETQIASGGGGRKERRKRNHKICIYFTILLILLIFIVFLILGFTIFKPKRLITTFDSISVEHLQSSLDPVNVRFILNLTLHVNLSLKNPNNVGFSYDSSSALLNYKGQLIGEAPLPANRVGPEETQPINLTLTLMADRLLSESKLFNDLMVGVIQLNTFVKVSGKVRVLKIFKLKVQSSSSCDLAISVLNRNVTSQNCTSQIT